MKNSAIVFYIIKVNALHFTFYKMMGKSNEKNIMMLIRVISIASKHFTAVMLIKGQVNVTLGIYFKTFNMLLKYNNNTIDDC